VRLDFFFAHVDKLLLYLCEQIIAVLLYVKVNRGGSSIGWDSKSMPLISISLWGSFCNEHVLYLLSRFITAQFWVYEEHCAVSMYLLSRFIRAQF